MNYRSISELLLFCNEEYIHIDLNTMELETAEQFFRVLDDLGFTYYGDSVAESTRSIIWHEGHFSEHVLTLWIENKKASRSYYIPAGTVYKLNPNRSLEVLK